VSSHHDDAVWLAPEVMEEKIYTEKADVYSIGVILWELLTRSLFFGEIRFMSQLEELVKAGKRPLIPDDCIPSYRSLIEDCWAQDPSAIYQPNQLTSLSLTQYSFPCFSSPHIIADQRPACSVIVERIAAIMREVCPEASEYDSHISEKHRARFEAEASEKSKALEDIHQKASSTWRTQLRARQTAKSRSVYVSPLWPTTRALPCLLSYSDHQVKWATGCKTQEDEFITGGLCPPLKANAH